MKILVTGSAGMIGRALVKGLLDDGFEVIGVDRRLGNDGRARYIMVDLGNREMLAEVIREHNPDKVVHLAALAHTTGEDDLSYEKYYHVNVECAENVFHVAENRPLLFISTVDVFGFTKGIVTAESEIHPVTFYGKTKALAEESCRQTCSHYTIFRLSPVYTPTVKRDIQKRYYLKFPNWAYVIGKGTEYEVLNIDLAVEKMVEWCKNSADNQIHIIKDELPMNTRDYIQREKSEGRAKHVIRMPRWIAVTGYSVLRFFTGKNKYTYLLNKAVHPLKSK